MVQQNQDVNHSYLLMSPENLKVICTSYEIQSHHKAVANNIYEFLSSVTLGAVNTLVEKVEHPFLFQSNIEDLTPVFQRGATAQSFLPGYVQLPNYD